MVKSKQFSPFIAYLLFGGTGVGSAVDQKWMKTVFPPYEEKKLDWQLVSFWMKLNKILSDFQKHCPFHFWE